MITENIFLELSKKVQNLGFNQSLLEISKIAFEEMDVDRITVWKFGENDTLNCEFKEDTANKSFDKQLLYTIDLNEFPAYYKCVSQEKIIIANDVFSNIFTFELEHYFRVQKICSALHIPIFVDGVLYGMVFFSTIDRYKSWTSDNIKFGSDVSQVISIAYISSKRNEDLRKLNLYAEKIKGFNSELQETINRKNEQFVEYGFINSHLLNAPLARLKGLMNILVYELGNEKKQKEIDFIIEKIYEEYNEMDKIVEKISILVNSGVSPDRDSIDS